MASSFDQNEAVPDLQGALSELEPLGLRYPLLPPLPPLGSNWIQFPLWVLFEQYASETELEEFRDIFDFWNFGGFQENALNGLPFSIPWSTATESSVELGATPNLPLGNFEVESLNSEPLTPSKLDTDGENLAEAELSERTELQEEQDSDYFTSTTEPAPEQLDIRSVVTDSDETASAPERGLNESYPQPYLVPEVPPLRTEDSDLPLHSAPVDDWRPETPKPQSLEGSTAIQSVEVSTAADAAIPKVADSEIAATLPTDDRFSAAKSFTGEHLIEEKQEIQSSTLQPAQAEHDLNIGKVDRADQIKSFATDHDETFRPAGIETQVVRDGLDVNPLDVNPLDVNPPISELAETFLMEESRQFVPDSTDIAHQQLTSPPEHFQGVSRLDPSSESQPAENADRSSLEGVEANRIAFESVVPNQTTLNNAALGETLIDLPEVKPLEKEIAQADPLFAESQQISVQHEANQSQEKKTQRLIPAQEDQSTQLVPLDEPTILLGDLPAVSTQEHNSLAEFDELSILPTVDSSAVDLTLQQGSTNTSKAESQQKSTLDNCDSHADNDTSLTQANRSHEEADVDEPQSNALQEPQTNLDEVAFELLSPVTFIQEIDRTQTTSFFGEQQSEDSRPFKDISASNLVNQTVSNPEPEASSQEMPIVANKPHSEFKVEPLSEEPIDRSQRKPQDESKDRHKDKDRAASLDFESTNLITEVPLKQLETKKTSVGWLQKGVDWLKSRLGSNDVVNTDQVLTNNSESIRDLDSERSRSTISSSQVGNDDINTSKNKSQKKAEQAAIIHENFPIEGEGQDDSSNQIPEYSSSASEINRSHVSIDDVGGKETLGQNQTFQGSQIFDIPPENNSSSGVLHQKGDLSTPTISDNTTPIRRHIEEEKSQAPSPAQPSSFEVERSVIWFEPQSDGIQASNTSGLRNLPNQQTQQNTPLSEVPHHTETNNEIHHSAEETALEDFLELNEETALNLGDTSSNILEEKILFSLEIPTPSTSDHEDTENVGQSIIQAPVPILSQEIEAGSGLLSNDIAEESSQRSDSPSQNNHPSSPSGIPISPTRAVISNSSEETFLELYDNPENVNTRIIDGDFKINTGTSTGKKIEGSENTTSLQQDKEPSFGIREVNEENYSAQSLDHFSTSLEKFTAATSHEQADRSAHNVSINEDFANPDVESISLTQSQDLSDFPESSTNRIAAEERTTISQETLETRSTDSGFPKTFKEPTNPLKNTSQGLEEAVTFTVSNPLPENHVNNSELQQQDEFLQLVNTDFNLESVQISADTLPTSDEDTNRSLSFQADAAALQSVSTNLFQEQALVESENTPATTKAQPTEDSILRLAQSDTFPEKVIAENKSSVFREQATANDDSSHFQVEEQQANGKQQVEERLDVAANEQSQVTKTIVEHTVLQTLSETEDQGIIGGANDISAELRQPNSNVFDDSVINIDSSININASTPIEDILVISEHKTPNNLAHNLTSNPKTSINQSRTNQSLDELALIEQVGDEATEVSRAILEGIDPGRSLSSTSTGTANKIIEQPESPETSQAEELSLPGGEEEQIEAELFGTADNFQTLKNDALQVPQNQRKADQSSLLVNEDLASPKIEEEKLKPLHNASELNMPTPVLVVDESPTILQEVPQQGSYDSEDEASTDPSYLLKNSSLTLGEAATSQASESLPEDLSNIPVSELQQEKSPQSVNNSDSEVKSVQADPQNSPAADLPTSDEGTQHPFSSFQPNATDFQATFADTQEEPAIPTDCTSFEESENGSTSSLDKTNEDGTLHIVQSNAITKQISNENRLFNSSAQVTANNQLGNLQVENHENVIAVEENQFFESGEHTTLQVSSDKNSSDNRPTEPADIRPISSLVDSSNEITTQSSNITPGESQVSQSEERTTLQVISSMQSDSRIETSNLVQATVAPQSDDAVDSASLLLGRDINIVLQAETEDAAQGGSRVDSLSIPNTALSSPATKTEETTLQQSSSPSVLENRITQEFVTDVSEAELAQPFEEALELDSLEIRSNRDEYNTSKTLLISNPTTLVQTTADGEPQRLLPEEQTNITNSERSKKSELVGNTFRTSLFG